MPDLSTRNLICIVTAPVVTAIISIIASSTIITNILRSNLKLSTIYRRLVFSLSVFDIVLSCSQVLSTFAMPAGTMKGSIGNEVTCSIQGCLFVIGMIGVNLYNLSLSVYFLLVIKYDINEERIKKYVEPFLHAIPIACAISVSTYLFAKQKFGPAGTTCWIESEPLPGCENGSQLDCLSLGKPDVTRMLIGGMSIVLFVFVSTSIIMVVIWRTFSNQIRRQPYRNSLTSSRRTTTQRNTQTSEEVTQTGESCCALCPIRLCSIRSASSQQNNNLSSSVLADRLSRPSNASTQRLKDISYRAIAYILSYLICHFFVFIILPIEIHSGSPAPYFLYFLARLLFPLQGFLNVLVYTYPHVASYRRNHSELNWFQAFWNVVRSGGDSDQLHVGTRRGRRERKQRNSIAVPLEV